LCWLVFMKREREGERMREREGERMREREGERERERESMCVCVSGVINDDMLSLYHNIIYSSRFCFLQLISFTFCSQ
jgi:hypothetical protein